MSDPRAKRSRKRKGNPTIRDEAEGVQRSAASEELYEIARRQLHRSAMDAYYRAFPGYRDFAKSVRFQMFYGMGDYVDGYEADPHADAIDVDFTVMPIQEPEPPPTLLLKERNLPGTDAGPEQ